MTQKVCTASGKLAHSGKLTAVGAAALGAGLSGWGEAQAVPIVTDVNLTAPNGDLTSFTIDLNNDGIDDFRFSSLSGDFSYNYDGNSEVGSATLNVIEGLNGNLIQSTYAQARLTSRLVGGGETDVGYYDSGPFAKQLQAGDLVNVGSGAAQAFLTFYSQSVYTYADYDGVSVYEYTTRSLSEWDDNPIGFVGLLFQDAFGTFFSGYAAVEVGSVTVTRFGFESEVFGELIVGSGQPANQPVPGPGVLTLLALGATGVLAMRRRRQSESVLH